MGTSYYRFKSPIKRVSIERTSNNYDEMNIWIEERLSGTLLVPKSETLKILQMFVQYEDDTKCPLRTHYKGTDCGTIATINDETLTNETYVVSEYGEIHTVKQIKEDQGNFVIFLNYPVGIHYSEVLSHKSVQRSTE